MNTLKNYFSSMDESRLISELRVLLLTGSFCEVLRVYEVILRYNMSVSAREWLIPEVVKVLQIALFNPICLQNLNGVSVS